MIIVITYIKIWWSEIILYYFFNDNTNDFSRGLEILLFMYSAADWSTYSIYSIIH